MEKKGNFWEELTQSFNPNFYCSIVGQSFGRTLRYIILLALFVAIVLSVKSSIDLKIQMFDAIRWAQGNLPEILSGIPVITIEKGEVFSSAQHPFVKRLDIQKDKVTFIIDTTGQITSLDGYEHGLLLTKNKLISKVTERAAMAKIEEHDLSKVDYFKLQAGEEAKGEIVNIAFNKKKTYQVTYKKLAKLLKIFPWVAFPIILIFLFSYYAFAKMLQLFIFSPLSLLIGKFAKAGISYPKILNIGAYALTPPTLLAALFIIIKVNIPAFWLLYMILYVFFLITALLKCKESLIREGELTK